MSFVVGANVDATLSKFNRCKVVMHVVVVCVCLRAAGENVLKTNNKIIAVYLKWALGRTKNKL